MPPCKNTAVIQIREPKEIRRGISPVCFPLSPILLLYLGCPGFSPAQSTNSCWSQRHIDSGSTHRAPGLELELEPSPAVRGLSLMSASFSSSVNRRRSFSSNILTSRSLYWSRRSLTALPFCSPLLRFRICLSPSAAAVSRSSVSSWVKISVLIASVDKSFFR